jgi:hypothetical protein
MYVLAAFTDAVYSHPHRLFSVGHHHRSSTSLLLVRGVIIFAIVRLEGGGGVVVNNILICGCSNGCRRKRWLQTCKH